MMDAMQPGRRAAAVAFIFITFMLDVFALGIVAPVLPKLILGFLGGDTARASEMVGLFGTVFALMQFACAPVLGALSDRFGRRPVILLSNFGLALDYVIMALAPNLAWLFAGRVIAGITTASFSAATAYIADVTPPEKRTGAFSMLNAAFGLGFVLGPALGGILGNISPRLPFWFAAGVSLANALYGLFVLPESLARERRSSHIAWGRANPLGSLALLRSHTELLGLATVTFLSGLAQQCLPAIFVLYGIYRYGWSVATIGLTLAVVGISQVVVSGALVQPLVARLGDRRALLVGLLCGAMGFGVYAFAATGHLFWLGIPIMSFWGLAAAGQSMMTHRVSASEQGRLQGALSGVRSIGMLIGPGIFTLTFAASIDPHRGWMLPGAPWLLAALLLLAALMLAWRVTRTQPAGARQAEPASAS